MTDLDEHRRLAEQVTYLQTINAQLVEEARRLTEEYRALRNVLHSAYGTLGKAL